MSSLIYSKYPGVRYVEERFLKYLDRNPRSSLDEICEGSNTQHSVETCIAIMNLQQFGLIIEDKENGETVYSINRERVGRLKTLIAPLQNSS